MIRIGHHNIGFLDPEDLNKEVLKSFPVIFDVKILLKNWPTGQATILEPACQMKMPLELQSFNFYYLATITLD